MALALLSVDVKDFVLLIFGVRNNHKNAEASRSTFSHLLLTMKFQTFLTVNTAALLAIYTSGTKGLYPVTVVQQSPASKKNNINAHRYRFETSTVFSKKSVAVSSTPRDNSEGNQEDEGTDDGKFLKLGTEIVKPFGPLGLIVAGINKEEYLDLIIDAFDKALPTGTLLPIAILGRSDIKKTFRELLSELQQRDCLLPADGDQLSLLAEQTQRDRGSSDRRQNRFLRYPLVLCSGFQVLQLQVCCRYGFAVEMSLYFICSCHLIIVAFTQCTHENQNALRSIESIADRLPVKPMMAMAVPNAMDKQILQLLEEIEGDHDSRLCNS